MTDLSLWALFLAVGLGTFALRLSASLCGILTGLAVERRRCRAQQAPANEGEAPR